MFEDHEELMELDGLLEDPESIWEAEEWEDWEGEELEDPEEEFGQWEAEEWEDLEGEFGQWESEDLEGDLFIGNLVKKAGRAIKKVARGPLGSVLKGVARQAAKVAGGAIGGPAGARIASTIANQVIRESESEDLYEDIFESESDFESDFESMGGDMEIFEEMEYLASLAAESESEAEADQFIGAIASLAGPLLSSLMGEAEDYEEFEGEDVYEDEVDYFLPALVPLAASVLPKAIPLVSKGIKAVGKALRASPRTRKTVRVLPRIAAKTAASVARQARAGRPPTRKRIAATMARQTASTLAKRRQLASAIQRNRMLARRRVQRRGPVIRPVPRVTARVPLRAVATPRPALVRRAVGGAVPMPSHIVNTGGYAPTYRYGSRRRRIVRPRYCVY